MYYITPFVLSGARERRGWLRLKRKIVFVRIWFELKRVLSAHGASRITCTKVHVGSPDASGHTSRMM